MNNNNKATTKTPGSKSQSSKFSMFKMNLNKPVNEKRAREEKIIKDNNELLPEWLKNAVKKINGTNYNSNPFFIENYQKIASQEIEVGLSIKCYFIHY